MSRVARACTALVGLAVLWVSACGAALAPTASAQPDSDSEQGTLRVLTYNIAGLPQGISASNPSVNVPLIGGLLNLYDLALIQEDFAYAPELRQRAEHPHVSAPFVRGERLNFGDGLSQFARLPFSELVREAWSACHGLLDSYHDCLTPKGFSFGRQRLADGVEVDVYNLHMDAGSSVLDQKARSSQVEQLLQAIERHSPGQALIVAGDTNVWGRESELLSRLQRGAGLSEVCRKLRCPQPWRIDRVYYRSSSRVELAPRSWRVDPRFVDARRRPLSDHLPVAVEFRWSVVPSPNSQ